MRHRDTLKRLNSVIQNHHNDCCVCACAIHTGYVYSPFGAVTATLGNNPNVNPFPFSSEFLDIELGLTYYNYRHYNPTDGKWINRDPIGVSGGHNLHCFVNNSPVDRIDRIGLLWWTKGESCDELKQKYLKWINDERDTSWTNELTPCPKKLKCTTTPYMFARCLTKCEPPDPNEWKLCKKGNIGCLVGDYHPGGIYEMRSEASTAGGHGNQCIYDECGKLMREIPAAGTADKCAPISIGHVTEDVWPFDLAKHLDEKCDGNGDYVKMYYEVRPHICEAP